MNDNVINIIDNSLFLFIFSILNLKVSMNYLQQTYINLLIEVFYLFLI